MLKGTIQEPQYVPRGCDHQLSLAPHIFATLKGDLGLLKQSLLPPRPLPAPRDTPPPRFSVSTDISIGDVSYKQNRPTDVWRPRLAPWAQHGVPAAQQGCGGCGCSGPLHGRMNGVVQQRPRAPVPSSAVDVWVVSTLWLLWGTLR